MAVQGPPRAGLAPDSSEVRGSQGPEAAPPSCLGSLGSPGGVGSGTFLHPTEMPKEDLGAACPITHHLGQLGRQQLVQQRDETERDSFIGFGRSPPLNCSISQEIIIYYVLVSGDREVNTRDTDLCFRNACK